MKIQPLRIALSLVVAALLGLGSAGAAGPESPMLLSQDPADGQKFAKTPESVTLTFSQPIDDTHSRFEIFDACGKRVDNGSMTVTLNEMKAELVKKPRGKYTVFYFMQAIPKGATGETTGQFTFSVKKGPACR